ncbi:MAG: peptidoglycan-binding protein [Oscillospiraceae bacterium]|nr:peptidoglycan-binding protein [Oscillospiraceae bacterium]
MLTGRQLAAHCEKVYKTKWVYWYGTCGYKCTRSLYESKKRQYPNHYTADRASGYERDIAAGKWCADCVGLIKSFFWSGGVFEGPSKYASNHCPDVSANGMIALCPQTGPIKTMPDIPGIVVWKPGHIGVHVGGGIVVEMKGFDYDCRRRDVSAGGWAKWGKLPASMISYSDEDGCGDCEIPEEPVGQRDLRNGDEGADVKQLQQNLIKLGYSCGKWGADGEFGDCTEQAVEAFQRAHGLAETGVYDAPTRAVMEEALDRLDAPVDDPRDVRIVGGNCYVRTAPNTRGAKLGVAHEGDVLPYQGQTSADGWHLVIFKNQNGWVSGKYSRLEG